MNKLSAKKNTIRLLFLTSLFLSSIASHASMIFINEIHYDNNGADTNEFVELAGTAGLNLMDWSLVFYNGSNGKVYKTVNIGDVSLNSTDQGFGFHAVSIIGMQNGSSGNGSVGDGIALIDNNSQLQQFISYEGAFEATNGIAQGIFSENINMIQNGSPAGMSLQLSGTGNNYQDFTWELANSTLGIKNASQHFIEKELTPPVQITEPNLTFLFLSIVVLMTLGKNRPKPLLRSDF